MNLSEDYLLHLDPSNCPRFDKARNLAKHSLEYTIIQNFFFETYQNTFQNLSGIELDDYDDLYSLCNYLQW